MFTPLCILLVIGFVIGLTIGFLPALYLLALLAVVAFGFYVLCTAFGFGVVAISLVFLAVFAAFGLVHASRRWTEATAQTATSYDN